MRLARCAPASGNEGDGESQGERREETLANEGGLLNRTVFRTARPLNMCPGAPSPGQGRTHESHVASNGADRELADVGLGTTVGFRIAGHLGKVLELDSALRVGENATEKAGGWGVIGTRGQINGCDTQYSAT